MPHAELSTGPLRRLEKHGAVAAVCLVAVGGLLRFPGIFEYWLNPDEGIYYSSLTQASFAQFWADVLANAHPPAYYLLLRGVGALTWDFFWFRALSALFGTAVIWVFWLVGRELVDRGAYGVLAGLTSAALVAFNSEAVVLSQIVRPYALVVILLASALYLLLRSRRDPARRIRVAYVVTACLALLTHYSAMLGVGTFTLVIAFDALTRPAERGRVKRLAAWHAIPLTLAAMLYLWHVAVLLKSDLMANALEAGGWLSAWLIESPVDAWNSLRAYQIFHLPDGLQGRTTLLLLASIGWAAATKDRMVAVVAGGALFVALVGSAAGVYPLSPSRHTLWLTVFTTPALGWLAAQVAREGKRTWVVAGLCLALLGAGGSWSERALGGEVGKQLGGRNNSTGEQVIRWDDLAALVVERMDRESGPRIILATEQTYHLLSPLYPADRHAPSFASDSSLFHFAYGSREIVVVRTWDWEGADAVAQILGSLPEQLPALASEAEHEVVVLAGGWGSALLPEVPGLQERGWVSEATWAMGRNPQAGLGARLAAVVMDWDAVRAARVTPRPPTP